MERLHTAFQLSSLSLFSRLIQAMERIDAFNNEEAAFGWELSQYPLRKQIHDKLNPYKKLYDNATDFLQKYDVWMNSRVGAHDPEDIESDVGTYFRNIYKLEKVFADRAATLNLATNVSYSFLYSSITLITILNNDYKIDVL